MAAEVSAQDLERNAIGLGAALFQSLTHIAPGVGLVFALTSGIPVAGAALPLSTFFSLIGTLFVAYSIGQLARVAPSAGYYMAWISRAFNTRLGFFAAWLTLAAEGIVPGALFLIIAWLMQGSLPTLLGVNPPWLLWDVLLAASVLWLAIVGVKVSARTGVILGTIELAVFTVLAIWLIARTGSGNSLAIFSPHAPGVKGGWSGVFRGMIFVTAAFAGFETAAPLAEETRNPQRNLPIAIVGATLAVGVFFVVASYAGVIAWGPAHLASYVSNSNPWETLARRVWGIAGVWIVFLALLNSTVANANAGENAASRLVYAMGRAGILPSSMGKVHPRFRSPSSAVIAVTVANFIISVVLGLIFQGPVGGFTFLVTVNGVFFMLLYVGACLAVPFLYRRARRADFHWLRHIVVPLAGVVVFAFPLVSSVYPPPGPPLNLAPYVDAAWILIGAALLLYLLRRQPAAVDRAAEVAIHQALTDGGENGR